MDYTKLAIEEIIETYETVAEIKRVSEDGYAVEGHVHGEFYIVDRFGYRSSNDIWELINLELFLEALSEMNTLENNIECLEQLKENDIDGYVRLYISWCEQYNYPNPYIYPMEQFNEVWGRVLHKYNDDELTMICDHITGEFDGNDKYFILDDFDRFISSNWLEDLLQHEVIKALAYYTQEYYLFNLR